MYDIASQQTSAEHHDEHQGCEAVGDFIHAALRSHEGMQACRHKRLQALSHSVSCSLQSKVLCFRKEGEYSISLTYFERPQIYCCILFLLLKSNQKQNGAAAVLCKADSQLLHVCQCRFCASRRYHRCTC